MSFTSFFGTLGHALTGQKAQQVAGAAIGAAVTSYSPGLGALVETVGNAIVAVEAKAAASGGAPGAAKKEQVKEIIDVSAPATVSVLNTVAGTTIDVAAVAPQIDKLIDDLVALFHAIGVFEPKMAATT